MSTKKLKNNTIAVSEVLGTVLLLVISVTLFSVVYASVLSIPNTPSTPSVTIIGTIEDNMLMLEHRGGDKLTLNSEILLSMKDGSTDRFPISQYLEDQYKENGWNIGERVIYDLDPNMQFKPVGVVVVDHISNSVVMMGTVQEPQTADIDIKMEINPDNPSIGDDITILITVSNRGPSKSEEIIIKYILPNGLKFNGFIGQNYDENSGIWKIDHLDKGESTTLEISATVIGCPQSEPTQLAMILDGSTSISSQDWNIMKEGLASAVENEDIFPHDGSVELTIVQFGGWDNNNPNAQLEIGGSVVVTNIPGQPGYYQTITNKIRNEIGQMGGYTPMACGIALAADVLQGSYNFNTHRHVINLVTDGQPNAEYNIDDRDYKMEDGWFVDNYDKGKDSAETAKDYLLNKLYSEDEINAIAVGNGNNNYPGSDINWLKTDIVWPGQYIAPPFDQGPGWVTHVSDYQEFADTIDELFNVIFNKIENHVELVETKYMDPNSENNFSTYTITISII